MDMRAFRTDKTSGQKLFTPDNSDDSQLTQY